MIYLAQAGVESARLGAPEAGEEALRLLAKTIEARCDEIAASLLKIA